MQFQRFIRITCVLLAAALSALAGAQTVSPLGINHLPVSVHLPRGTAGRISAATLAASGTRYAREEGLALQAELILFVVPGSGLQA